MLRLMWTSKSNMMAQQNKLDSISNNIANLNTEGYKREQVTFKDLMYETLEKNGSPVSLDRTKEPFNGTGVKTGNWIRDTKQGNLRGTEVNTDLAIDGEGYFSVNTTSGATGYVRNGSFSIDGNGNIVDKSGNKLNIEYSPNGKKILKDSKGFTKENLLVKEDGGVFIKSDKETLEVGKINIYNAVGDSSFRSIGDNLYEANANSQVYVNKNAKVQQGYLEESNVDISKEMTDMIITQRAFELGSRGLKTADDMWGMVNNLKGR